MEGEECPALAPPGHAVTLSRCHETCVTRESASNQGYCPREYQNTIIIQQTPFKIEKCRFNIQVDCKTDDRVKRFTLRVPTLIICTPRLVL